jgi:hypothetical protein
VSESATVFLAIMAVSVAIMAAIQIGLIIVGIQAARKLGTLADDLRREVRPLMDKVNRIADDAGRATSLAALQVERVDQLMASTAARVDDTLGVIQGLMGGPVRQSAVAVAAFKAALAAFRHWQDRRQRPREHEDEDAWFVG